MIKIPFKAVIVLVSFLVLVSCGGGGGGGATDDSSFTIGYNANGAESGSVPSSQNGNGKTALAVSYNTGNLAKSGYLFDGWNTQPDGYGADYVPGTEYKGKDITLYAKWAAIFNYNIINLGFPAQALNGVQRVLGNPIATITGLTSRGMTLSDITIPRTIDGYTVVAIGDNAFQGCTNVSNILIADTISDIGNNAFNGCSNLSGLTLQGTVPPTLGTNAFTGCILLAVSVPQSAASAYNSSPTWSTVAILAPGTFSIIYNGNGSDGGIVPARQVGMIGITINVYGNNGSLTRTGCTFNGWNTKTDGTGLNFAANSPYAGPDNMTLYAQWTHPDYTVTFDDQGADIQYVSPSTIKVKAPANTIYSLPSTPPRKNGYNFAGWYTGENGTGDQFLVGSRVTSSMTVYAKWVENDCTVSYDGNGATSGFEPESHATQFNQSITLRSNTGNLRKNGYEFGGWNTKADGTGANYEVGANYTVTGDVTLYAKWLIYSSIPGNRENITIGDIVLSDGKTVDASVFSAFRSAYIAADGVPVGVVAYKGGEITTLNGSLGSQSAGIIGKIYMVGLSHANNKTWGAVPSSITVSPSDGIYNWEKIQTVIKTDEKHPAFKYANNYTVTGYTNGWFLPSVAELNLMYSYFSTINTGVITAGGTALPTTHCWSSYYQKLDWNNAGYYPFVCGLNGCGYTESNHGFPVCVIHVLD